ncbi:hypothetical protein HZS_1083, partial [Henneguya salminicola]
MRLALLKYNILLFGDCTFRPTPPPFPQCLIIRSLHLGCSILPDVVVLLEYSRMPKKITIDFELMLIKAIPCEFPE